MWNFLKSGIGRIFFQAVKWQEKFSKKKKFKEKNSKKKIQKKKLLSPSNMLLCNI